MKQFIPLLICCTFFGGAYAQSNNPYDENGKKIVESVKFLQSEIKAGNIKELDEATVASYSAKLPIANKASLELVSEVTQAVTKSSIEEIAEKSRLSSRGKEIMLDMHYKSTTMDRAAYRDYLYKTTDVILASRLPAQEQELLLTGTSTIYHGYAEGDPTYVITDPVIAWTFTGLIIGDIICGPPCGFAGAIIGFIVGTLFSK